MNVSVARGYCPVRYASRRLVCSLAPAIVLTPAPPTEAGSPCTRTSLPGRLAAPSFVRDRRRPASSIRRDQALIEAQRRFPAQYLLGLSITETDRLELRLEASRRQERGKLPLLAEQYSARQRREKSKPMPSRVRQREHESRLPGPPRILSDIMPDPDIVSVDDVESLPDCG